MQNPSIPVPAAGAAWPRVRRVGAGAPLHWLRLGLSDTLACPLASLFYGACLASLGFLLFFYSQQSVKYIAALTSGFLLAGPFVAIGLYDLSRRRERGEPCALGPSTIAWYDNSNAIALFGLVLGVVMLAWTGVALMLFDLRYGGEAPALGAFLQDVLALRETGFLVAYTLAGSVFAALVFALSVVSIPMMLDRRCGVLEAIGVSLAAVRHNLPAMALWAFLITALTLAGLLVLYVGLILTMPVVGHASWHAYRELVAPDA